MVKNPPANAGDLGSVPESERPLERNGNPLQCSCPGKCQGQRSLGGLQSMGSSKVGHNSQSKQQGEHVARVTGGVQKPGH